MCSDGKKQTLQTTHGLSALRPLLHPKRRLRRTRSVPGQCRGALPCWRYAGVLNESIWSACVLPEAAPAAFVPAHFVAKQCLPLATGSRADVEIGQSVRQAKGDPPPEPLQSN